MKQEIEAHAWFIVSGLHQLIASDDSLNTLEKTEAVRLASLTFAIADKLDYAFTKLSYEAERFGVSLAEISGVVSSALDSFDGPNLSDLTRTQLTTLLGLIHSIGSYQLPVRYDQDTSQKPLGAFYTPQRIADYIVSLTLAPTLEKLAESASKRGIIALEEIMSLRTLDPACGTGVFLISALSAYIKAMERGFSLVRSSGITNEAIEAAGLGNYRRRFRHNLYGVDVDAGALEITDVSLGLLSRGSNDSTFGTCLRKGNSLVSLKGLAGNQNHRHYYSDPDTRHPFEWGEEFEEVIGSGGFDFVVMNPPYERLKPNLAEFLRERISSGDREIRLQEFDSYKAALNEDLQYFRKSGEYQLGNKYTIDVHRLFIERAIQLTRINGHIGFIVPSTILGDLSAHPIRKSILLENQLNIVNDFPETSRLFEGVTQSVSVLSFQRGGSTKSFQAQFGMRDIGDSSKNESVRINTNKIRSVSGKYYSIPQVNKKGWNLLEKIHSHPSISSTDWLWVKRGELDLTLNRSCIVTDETNYRLIRGSHLSRFALRSTSARPEEFVDLANLKKSMKNSSRIGHIGQTRIACQQVSNRTQRWRLKFANIPANSVLANSCNYLHFQNGTDEDRVLVLLGILNSELINWRFELTNTNNHVSTRELSQLPIPEIDAISKDHLYDLVSGVKSVRGGNDGSYAGIDSIVFSIYGFSKRDAKTVMGMRRTPSSETQEILDGMSL
ncbi:MAG: Eco57I restriction-modification methylase domain-containing protein [Candidatus Thorarchaeota archaeon]